MNKTKLGLVFGGKSAEHEVSLMSVTSVLKVIEREKYVITLFYITKDGIWTIYDGAEEEIIDLDLKLTGRPLSSEIIDNLYLQDVILPVIHGPHGEDGSLQGLFESLEIPYIGSKVLGSAVCMDKIISKKIAKNAGIDTVKYFEIYDDLDDLDNLKQWIEKYPLFVKPSNMGSSVGISKVNDETQLIDAIKLALEYDRRVLVEEGIDVREIECAVLESDGIIVSGVGEVLASNDFYDYDAKYVDDGTEKMKVPALDISEDMLQNIRKTAKRAFLEHGCNGLARIDFFIEKETDRIILNEINTLPGMTAFSMYPCLFEEIGISYTELLNKMIDNIKDHS